jgi:hypothetical protein
MAASRKSCVQQVVELGRQAEEAGNEQEKQGIEQKNLYNN